MRALSAFAAALLAGAAFAGTAGAVVTGPSGYIYSTQLLGNLTEGCIAAGPGGTFVGIGPSFTANAEAIVLAKESGELRLVALGFNAISDCAYDAAADVLYVTDNADNADFGITTSFAGNTGAQTGDTVFAIPNASTAAGLGAKGLELLPANSIEFAASVAVDAARRRLRQQFRRWHQRRGPEDHRRPDAEHAGHRASTLAGGIALSPATGNLFVAENLGLPNFDNEIRQYTAAGAPVPPTPFAGPSFAFGSTTCLQRRRPPARVGQLRRRRRLVQPRRRHLDALRQRPDLRHRG